MVSRKNWSREELILTFNLYCKLPFGQYYKTNRKVQELAKIIGRTPSAVALKLGNFARLDPFHQKRGVKGLQHGSHLEEEVWEEFNQNWGELAFQSENLLANFRGKRIEEMISSTEELPEGKEKDAIVKVRINQSFFREMILASYKSRCAVCLFPEEKLLVASHIVPWSQKPALRMNPRNGICMCSLHDRAFDTGLISFDSDYRLLVSALIRKFSKAPAVQRGFLVYDASKMLLPDRFVPEPEFIDYHRKNIFVA